MDDVHVNETARRGATATHLAHGQQSTSCLVAENLERSGDPATRAWKTIAQGDNGIDLVSIVAPVASLKEGSRVAQEIAQLSASSPYPNNEDIQITVRNWEVQVIMSAPTNHWTSSGQMVFAATVARHLTCDPQ